MDLAGLYLGSIQKEQHLVQGPTLLAQLFPQSLDGGATADRFQVQGGPDEAMDGAVRKETGGPRLQQEETFGAGAPQTCKTTG